MLPGRLLFSTGRSAFFPFIHIEGQAQKHHQQTAAGGIFIAPACEKAQERKKDRPQNRMRRAGVPCHTGSLRCAGSLRRAGAPCHTGSLRRAEDLRRAAGQLQPVTVQGDKAHDENRTPQVIAGPRLPQHGLPKHHPEHPQKQVDQEVYRRIIFFLMLHILIDQQSEQHKRGGIRHVEHHFVRQQEKTQDHMAHRTSRPGHILRIFLREQRSDGRRFRNRFGIEQIVRHHGGQHVKNKDQKPGRQHRQKKKQPPSLTAVFRPHLLFRLLFFCSLHRKSSSVRDMTA